MLTAHEADMIERQDEDTSPLREEDGSSIVSMSPTIAVFRRRSIPCRADLGAAATLPVGDQMRRLLRLVAAKSAEEMRKPYRVPECLELTSDLEEKAEKLKMEIKPENRK